MHKLPLSIRAVACGCNNSLAVVIRRSGPLKILALIFSLSFFTAPGANAQGGWEAPVTAWDPTWFMRPIVTPGGIKAQHGLLLYWQRATCDKNGNMIGSPRVAIYNADPGVTVKNVSVTAIGIGCDGKQGKGIYQASELGPYDRKANNYWDRCYFRAISKVVAVRFDYDIGNLHYYVQYDQEQGVNSIRINGVEQDEWLKQQQQKAEDLKKQVADAKKKFDNIVLTYNQQLNNLRNAQTKSNFSNALNNWQRQFNAAEQQAQQYLTVSDKDKVQPQLDLLNEITRKLNTNLGELGNAVEKENQAQSSAKPGSTGGTQNTNASQNRTTASTNGNAQTNQRTTTTTTTNNSNARSTQSQAYQQQADNYLNAANNSSDAIQQSLNLNLAKTNAIAGGNTYQVQQIQQAQSQAQQANQQAMASSLGDLASATMGYFDQKARNKELDRQQALEYQQYERQRQAEMQAAQRAQEQEQARRNAAVQAERQAALERQWNTDKEALGNYLTHRTSSTIPENKKEAFFIVYERLHPLGTSYSVVKMRTYAIEKYSDGTWMPIIDLLNKLKCTEAFDLDRTKIGLGYFSSKQEALQFIENIKGYFKERVTTDMSFITINQSLQSTPLKDNFWNQ